MVRTASDKLKGKVVPKTPDARGKPEAKKEDRDASKEKDRDAYYGDLGIRKVNLRGTDSFETTLAIELTEDVLQYHRMIPLRVTEEGRLHLVMADPLDMVAQQIVSSRTGLQVEPLWCPEEDIEFAIGRIFSPGSSIEETLQELVEKEDEPIESVEEEESIDLLRSQATDAPAVLLVNSLLVQAIQERASDIHIEPQENHLRIRQRIDGVLRDFPPADRRLQSGVIARTKILASLDIAERRLPQDGRVKFKIMGRSVDVRVSTVPGIYGEKIVLRILDKGSTSLNIEDIGFNEHSLPIIKQATRRDHGMILSTGPTGSGKTTTIYSILNLINSPSVNILTVEDPVEYRLSGINQVQVQPGIGLTFASALRSFLRQDPDVIMVGEIRDHETGEMAVRAALTGHLVLSTLHTNSAIATIVRLLDMGIARYLIVASVSVIFAQRLVRRICMNCKEPAELTKEVRATLSRKRIDLDDDATFYRGQGCEDCSFTGYWGRMAITEVFSMDSEIRELINAEKPESEIVRAAESSGMVPLLRDGYEKAARGLTTLEEVLRVI
ncbi:MAG: GspE/PulE family protein [Nitrososphaerales archaeon]